MDPDQDKYTKTFFGKLRRVLVGQPKSFREPSIFHKLSLVPILAWIGLGADGLSSSSYGPAEAYAILGSHTHLAIFLGIATAFTVFIISYSYSRIIEHFPHGGGGYIVASHTIGKDTGIVSGSSLLVDYVLTITVSLSSCGDAVFSYFPPAFHVYKLPFVLVLILALVLLNIRGVKESITILTPIFIIFVVTHVLMIGYGIASHIPQVVPHIGMIHDNLKTDYSIVGSFGLLILFLRAFSFGAGTYTGIEAVSNGMQIMREPKVQTGKRTMAYMASSLAITACGLYFCYFLFDVVPSDGKTLNAVLAGDVFKGWPLGNWIALVTIFTEGALLIVAAQAGFIDGPRVMANMAIDGWLPRRFAALSERLTMQNGVILMGAAAIAVLFYTGGSVSHLLVMYAINVFITFSLSQFGMMRFFMKNKERDVKWKKHITVHVIGFILCVTILFVTILEKFTEGGWVTLVITGVVIALCYMIRSHYLKVKMSLRHLEETLEEIPETEPYNKKPVSPEDMTAVLLVSGFNGFGLHMLLSVVRNFPDVYKNFIFVSVGEIDSGSFKGIAEIEALKKSIGKDMERYVKITRRHGFPAGYRTDIGTDVVETAVHLVEETVKDFPRYTVFAGKLIFPPENPFQHFLHNETAFAIQRRLQWDGIATVVLPVRVDIKKPRFVGGAPEGAL